MTEVTEKQVSGVRSQVLGKATSVELALILVFLRPDTCLPTPAFDLLTFGC